MIGKFISNIAPRRDQIAVIDLSSQLTRCVLMRGRTGSPALMDYAFREMPGSVSGISRESLAEHFARTVAMLGTPFKEVILVIGMEDVLWRDIDLPAAELSDLRKVIRFNARTCFQQDVSDYAIDCTALTPVEKGMDEESSKRRKAVPILAAGIKKELLTKLKLAAEDARLKVVELLPSQTGVLNAVMLAKPEAAQKEAMIVIGLEVAQATISFVVENTLMLTRVVAPSEGNLRTQLTEAFKTGAEIPADFRWEVVQSNVKTLFTPLAEEFKAAIDYFEDVHGRRVRHGFVTGELAGSELIINTLQDLQIPCQQLDSSGLFQSEHLPQERKESLTKDFVQLAGAIGAAVVWLSATGIQINFLAEEIAEAASRRRDPFRIGCKLAALLVILMLSWAGWLHSIASRAAMGLKAREPEIVSTAKASREATLLANRAGEAARSAAALEQHATNRFRAGPLLKALSHTTLDDIQMVHVSLRQQLIQVPATKSGSDGTKTIPAKPEHTLERVVLRVQAKNFGDAAAEDRFIEINSHQSYFQEHLSSENPIVLKARLPRQVDPLDSSKTFTLFTLDYVYPERVLGHE